MFLARHSATLLDSAWLFKNIRQGEWSLWGNLKTVVSDDALKQIKKKSSFTDLPSAPSKLPLRNMANRWFWSEFHSSSLIFRPVVLSHKTSSIFAPRTG